LNLLHFDFANESRLIERTPPVPVQPDRLSSASRRSRPTTSCSRWRRHTRSAARLTT